MTRYFLLELHDMMPPLDREQEDQLLWAYRFGADEPLILCTPLHRPEDQSPADDDPENRFYEKITSRKGEIVLHGLSHRSPPGYWDRLWYGEESGAEFKKLSEAEARQRLQLGRVRLEGRTGRTVRWFCAPRWQQSRGTVRALRELNFKGYFTQRGLHGFPRTFLPLPVISFDHGRRRWINRLNRHIERQRLARCLERGRPFRLALHPADMGRPAVVDLLWTIREMLASAGWQVLSPAALGDMLLSGWEKSFTEPEKSST